MKFERHSTVTIVEALKHIGDQFQLQDRRSQAKVILNGLLVNVSSLRLKTFFAKGTKCVACGLEAEYFALERDANAKDKTGPFHLNLWGTDSADEPIIFTHDHIMARSLGGKDDLTNTQTMCGPCNWEKGKAEIEEKNRRNKLVE
jgi:hypothetical protein